MSRPFLIFPAKFRSPPKLNAQIAAAGVKFAVIRSSMAGMQISRRSFVALSATLPFAMRAYAKSSIPIGLELYSVREGLKQDPQGTVRAVAALGYQCMEFYSPYFDWTEAQAKDMRQLLDDLGVRCYSTHNRDQHFSAENIN